MSAAVALDRIDAKIESLREGGHPILGKQAVIDILMIIRKGLTEAPADDEVSRLVAELEGERAAEMFMTILYTSAIRHVEGERDRARALAVRLEQDLALFEVGIGRRPL